MCISKVKGKKRKKSLRRLLTRLEEKSDELFEAGSFFALDLPEASRSAALELKAEAGFNIYIGLSL